MRLSRFVAGTLAGILTVACLGGCGGIRERRTIGTIAPKEEENAVSAGKTIHMVIASNQISADNPYHYGLQTFKEVVEELSQGTIQVECSDGTLSENETELVEMLDGG